MPNLATDISKVVTDKLYNGKTFYRSDFVIQCGLHPAACPYPNLTVNETSSHVRVSNTRGTAAIAHWDVPDCGNSEFFINLQTNAHLDSAYGGYCVFAQAEGSESDATMTRIAEEVKQKGSVKIEEMVLVD